MVDVTLRNVKGSPLTFDEVDENFTNLKDAIESVESNIDGTVDLRLDALEAADIAIDGRLDAIEAVSAGSRIAALESSQSTQDFDIFALEQNQVRYAATKAAGVALAASLPDGATVVVDADESATPAGLRVRYTVASGLLTDPVPDTAAGVQFTPSVTGAVPTAVEAKLRERKSFFDFLTDPGRAAAYSLRLGTLDYTAELQAAADYSAGNGPAIDFPEGLAPHTGIIFSSGTVFIGSGVGKTELLNTHATNDSVRIPYLNDGNFYRDWGISGFTINAANSKSPSQSGIRMDTSNHGYMSRLMIKNHFYGVREKVTWSSYFEFVDCDTNEYGWYIEDGVTNPGVPNTRNCIGLNSNAYGIDIAVRGVNALKWTGGHIERSTNWAIRILGNTNRTITFDGLNIEGNNNASDGFDVIIGSDADASSGPSVVRFSNCQFTDPSGGAARIAFDLNRGVRFMLDSCFFINYLRIADLSTNFGDFTLLNNSGPIFSNTSDANTTIPSNGVITGTPGAFTQEANGARTTYQLTETQPLLASRRYSETINRFNISADGILTWRPFNNATPNLTVKRHVSTAGVNVGGVEATDCWRTGLNTTANRPSAASVGAGSQFYDTTLSKPIWSDGTVWRDAAGTAV